MNNRILYIPHEKKSDRSSLSRRKHAKRMLGLVGVVLALLSPLIAVRLPFFHIKTIEIKGATSIDKETVRKVIAGALEGSYALLIPYQFLWTAPEKRIIADISKTFPLVAEVQVKKEFPDKLSLLLRERTLFGIICNDRMTDETTAKDHKNVQCAYLDMEGIAYQKAPQPSGFLITKISIDTPISAVPIRLVEPKTMSRILFLHNALPLIIDAEVVGYELISHLSHEMRAVSSDGFTIIFKRDDEFDRTFNVLKTVLKEIGNKRSSLDYIDLRFGNKVFYKER